ncbi:hypothetical protein CASFOL_023842 [Castilleja foliolosa]|uniref:Uncharacterized protein n=1 Tax=Castilleja foliolosa TaxID=1961234 RepID=A0ABD3CMK5_9LAMI
MFVSRADPEKEPPLVTSNTILAAEYPVEKLVCYVSDDGGGLLTFEAIFLLFFTIINPTTYGNFRYRYDRVTNPYNKGLVDNFKEIFYGPTAPSKNDFRAMVPKEPPLPARSATGGLVSPNMGKGVDDIEMGRKADGGGLGEMFPEIRMTVDEGDRAGIHARRSSWGRKSGSWEMSPEFLALARPRAQRLRRQGDERQSHGRYPPMRSTRRPT